MESKFPILLVEDNEGDIFIFKRLAKKAELENLICIARDGEQAVEYLAGTGKYADRAEYPVPGLVVLDLKIPRKDGCEVLRWIRAQPATHELNVVVLTSSAEPRDLTCARELGALSYLIKPPTLESVVEIGEALKRQESRSAPLKNISRGLLGA
jgi:CheY-like chemotaxis protein